MFFCQVGLYTFVTPLASSIMAPGLPDLATKFNITNPTVTALTLSIFLLSFAIGPLFAAPLSEVYGRLWVRRPFLSGTVCLNELKVLHLANLFFLVFNLGCALSRNSTSFIVFRFLGTSWNHCCHTFAYSAKLVSWGVRP